MKLLAIALIILAAGITLGEVHAQSISIKPIKTISVTVESPVTGLSGMTIEARAEEGVLINCAIQGRSLESCLHPVIASWSFTDLQDDIQGAQIIDPMTVFEFTGTSGTHDVIFNVVAADDDAGNPIIFSQIVTQITLP